MHLTTGMMTVFWLVVLIVSLLGEAATVGLTCIWVSGGALVALILNYVFNVSFTWQVIAFFTVTFILLIATRPFARKYINSHRTLTNYESLIGKKAYIEDTVDNGKETGKAILNGQEWTVRSENDEEIIEKGAQVRVVNVAGVKLIVHKIEEE